jgi:hypothetical protein
MINFASNLSENKKKFIGSSMSGLLVYLISLAFSNLLQFVLFVNISEVYRTDLTVIISFFFGTGLNFYIHNYKIFKTKLRLINYIKFINTNLIGIFTSVIFWNIFEFFSGLPSLFEFNFFSILIVVCLFPIKFLFYKKIFNKKI